MASMRRSEADPRRAPPRAAMALGAAGLAPFAAGAIGALVARPPADAVLLDGLLLYGAVILSFMGGCRWGFRAAGLTGEDGGEAGDWRAYGVSVLPALWGFFALLSVDWIGAPAVAAALAAGFVALYVADRFSAGVGAAPPWWPRLRLPLTLGATASLAIPAALLA